MLANCPDETAPCTQVAKVKQTMAADELQPENANPSTKSPFTIVVIAPASFRTLVRLIRLLFSNQSAKTEKR